MSKVGGYLAMPNTICSGHPTKSGRAKLQFACSANMLEYVEGININAEQKAILTEIPDTMFQQTVRDFITNQQFRKDYWVKGTGLPH